MSLDVYLMMSLDEYLENQEEKPDQKSTPSIYIRENGSTKKISRTEWDLLFPGKEPFTVEVDEKDYVFTGNITHNLGRMAAVCGIYSLVWKPEENGITKASQLIEPLTKSIESLRSEPDKYKLLNPSNGWGNYEGFLSFLDSYLEACKLHPDALVSTYR